MHQKSISIWNLSSRNRIKSKWRAGSFLLKTQSAQVFSEWWTSLKLSSTQTFQRVLMILGKAWIIQRSFTDWIKAQRKTLTTSKTKIIGLWCLRWGSRWLRLDFIASGKSWNNTCPRVIWRRRWRSKRSSQEVILKELLPTKQAL